MCRPNNEAGDAFYDEVEAELNRVVGQRLNEFEDLGLRGADYFVSAIGPAFEVFASHRSVTRLDGTEVSIGDLMELARKAVARHAMGRLLAADTLGVLDDRSLLYVTWRWAYLTVPVPADEAIKLSRAFSVSLDDVTMPGGMVSRKGKNFSLLGPHERPDVRLRPDSPLIDVLHVASQLWDAGRANEVIEVLAASGCGTMPGFWDVARALAEVLPEGQRERTMYQALATSQQRLAEAAAKQPATSYEELQLSF